MCHRFLFTALSAEVRLALDNYGLILKKAAAGGDLSRSVRELSALLTDRRAERQVNYLNHPKFLAAYLHYFLPWNLYRLGMLLPNLPFDPPDDSLIADIGCGPLTAVQALWLFRPDLRSRRLTFHCLDFSIKAMRKGLDLFKTMSGDNIAWKIRLLEGNMSELAATKSRADFIFSLNVLNEQKQGRGGLEKQLGRHIDQLAAELKRDGRLFMLEPGNRLGGRLLSLARKRLIELGFNILSPCTHQRNCPMLPQRTSWCHFRRSINWSPWWLRELSIKSGLSKKELSLSLLYARRDQNDQEGISTQAEFLPARIISNPFTMRDRAGLYCYGCAPNGLVCFALEQAAKDLLQPGDFVFCRKSPVQDRDQKSGAYFVKAVF